MAFDFLKDNKQTFAAHFNDLRKFIIYFLIIYIIIFAGCFYFSNIIYYYLEQPILTILQKKNINNTLIVTNVTEVFFNYIKIAFYSSLVIFTPLFLVLLYFFVKPALAQKVRKFSVFIILLVPILFLSGIALAYFFGIKIILSFFIDFTLKQNLTILPSVANYITLILQVLVAFGICFELPVLLLLLNLFDIIDEKSIIKFGRYAIVIAFVVAAIFTPPDPFSQILVALVMIILYYLSYFLIKFLK